MTGRRRPRDRREGGAVMVETALVAGIVLTFLLFSVQVGILGFLQVTADAASFVGARVATLSSASPGAYMHTNFSQIAQSDVTLSSTPAPQATVPVDYGYNTNTTNSQYHRLGGYSALQPVLETVSVQHHTLGSGINTTVKGADVEAMWTECGAHFNVANSASNCGDSAAPTNFAVDYLSKGENTSPYFVGFNEVTNCTAPQPWGGPPGSWQAPNGESRDTCPNASGGASQEGFIAYGVAEFLYTANWNRSVGGVIDPASTFAETSCHQRAYADLATFFTGNPSYTSLSGLYKTIGNQILNNYHITSFKSWGAFDSTTNSRIAAIYGWDNTVVQNAPPAKYQLNPSGGCNGTF